MAIENFEIARIFSDVANLLELKGENPFRIRAYRNAARSIANWPKNLSEEVENKKMLPHIAGIGADLEEKVREICEKHTLKLYDQLTRQIPKGLVLLLTVPGLGPKRVRMLWDQFKVKNIQQLRSLAQNHEIQKLSGFGEKLESQILENVEKLQLTQQRIPWLMAQQMIEPITRYLKKWKSHLVVTPAGSFRRHQETVGDLDLLAVSDESESLISHFCKYPAVQRISSAGTTRATLFLNSGAQVDLRVVPEKSYGAALVYFTGSKNHNIEIRKIAQQSGLKINEYGVFRGTKQIGGLTEEEVYHSIGLSYIEPELRENQGEVEAAKNGALPQLINDLDIRGDLHVHSKFSDGSLSLAQIAHVGKSMGYQYLALTDHTQRLRVAHGLTPKVFTKEMEMIDQLNESFTNFKILKGAEVDILENGTLDLPRETLKKLDVVLCAVHSSFHLSKEKQTKRILTAIRNPCVHILAHPTGRLIQERMAYEVDMEQIIKEAKSQHCALEINSQPSRLDLNDHYIRMAKDEGVKFSIATDSHSTQEFEFMSLGVHQARRGWLEKTDVINTYSLEELLKHLKVRR